MTTLSASKALSNFNSLLKKVASGEKVGVRYGKKVIVFTLADDEDTSYAEKEYGVTKEELKRFTKRMHAEGVKDRKAGKSREYTGDIEALLKD